MNKNELNNIPDICLNSYQDNSSGLLILGMDELYEKHMKTISRSHRSSLYQLYLIMEGECSICVDSIEHCCSAKTLLPVSKGQIEICELNKNTKGYVLLFSDEYIYKYPDDLGWINNLKLFDYSVPPSLINLTDMEYIDLLILFKNTRKESVSLNEYGKDEVLFNLLRILLITSERIKRTRINNSIKDIGDLTLLEDFKKHLEIHYSNSRSVQYYSDILNITPKKLNRVTFSYWGKSSKQVIEERVLLETKRLLIHTNQSVKEIGMLLGFNDPTNFNKFFKKSTNMTPVYFRLSYKKLI